MSSEADPQDGTERMRRRLEVLFESTAPMSNPFLNVQRLAYLDASPVPADPIGTVRLNLQRANEALRAGESARSAELLAAVIAEVEADPKAHPPRLPRRLRRELATAHFRRGEQENCVLDHSIDSCLLPIRGDGVHRLPSGSRAALAELDGLLRESADDLMLVWLYNLAAMTLGEYPEGVPVAWRVPPEVFESEAELQRFPDVSSAIGLATEGLAGGSVVDDFDGDGVLDVFVSSWGLTDPLRLFRGRVDDGDRLSFEEATAEAGLDRFPGGLNLIHADYDNDGDLDLFVLRGAWLRQQGRHPNSLLRNDGRGRFVDVTEAVGLLSFRPTQTATWGDYDNDGWLDLYIGNESSDGIAHPGELFRNNGPDGSGGVTFSEVAADAGVQAGGVVKGVVWGDYDNDGWLDLYLSRLRGPNILFRNLGRGADGTVRFTDVTDEAGVAEPIDGFPTWFFDYDNDGWLDLFAGGYANSFVDAEAFPAVAEFFGRETSRATPRLYRNLGVDEDGVVRFSDATKAGGLHHPMLAMGANFGDLNNDGWPDLYVGTGAPDFRALVPNRMFLNDTGERFLDVTTAGGFGHLQKGHGISFADFDRDGDQDVLAVMGGAFSGDVYRNAVFANPGMDGRWITLRLVGRQANRSAIGARIRVDLATPSGPRQVHAVVSSGGSFGASSLQQEIGLGDAVGIVAVEIDWPAGGRQVLRDLPIDSIIEVTEGSPEARVIRAPALRFAEESMAAHSVHHGPSEHP